MTSNSDLQGDGVKPPRFSDEEVAKCVEAMSKPSPLQALATIASGRVLIELSKDRRNVCIIALDGKRVRDPDYPNDPSRKIGLAGAWPLYRAGMIDEYGVITPAGLALLNAEKKDAEHG